MTTLVIERGRDLSDQEIKEALLDLQTDKDVRAIFGVQL